VEVIDVVRDGIPDVHSEKPLFELDVDNVGLRELRGPVMKIREYMVIPVFKVSVNLPASSRGAHLSRLYRAYTGVVKPGAELTMDLLRQLAIKLLEVNEYAVRAVVSVKGRLYHVVDRGDVPEYSSNGFIYAGVRYEREGVVSEYSGGGVYGLTTCPCAGAVSRYIYGEPYTHMQKVRINAYIKSSKTLIEPIEVFEKLKTVVYTPRNYLKRIEEAEFVKMIYEKPLFTEDIARLAAVKLAELVANRGISGSDGILYVSVRSYETIHEYIVESIVRTRLTNITGFKIINKT
jgi:GTP cyclohydrolase-4